MNSVREFRFEDYLAIARRRRWWIVVPPLVLAVVACLVPWALPNRYVSQTLVLIDAQKVPDNYVKPVMTEELNQRLATMKEQILSRAQLEPVIRRFDLFKEDWGKVPIESLIDRMRDLVT